MIGDLLLAQAFGHVRPTGTDNKKATDYELAQAASRGHACVRGVVRRTAAASTPLPRMTAIRRG